MQMGARNSFTSYLSYLIISSYHIVVLTNQGSVSLRSDPKTLKADQRSLANFKTKANAVLTQFDFPIYLLAATARDIFRKPRTGMWRELLDELDMDPGKGPDLEESFFVGDAGGRAAAGDRKADHACSDRDFAANVGIKFHTPEEYFLKEDPQPFTRNFEPKDYLIQANLTSSTDITPIVFERRNELDIVVMCGCPGCGKSTFYWNKLRPLGYERVNQDILKSRDKCVKAASAFLDSRTSVAVDNTNADTDTRAVWVKLASDYQVPIRGIHFTAPVKLCEHNDTVRALAGEAFNPEKRSILPHSAFHSFKARFKDPQVREGLQDVVKVDFQYQRSEEAKKIWTQYWI